MTSLWTPLIWALFTALALRPPFRGGRAGFGTYLLSMVVNEAPLPFLVLFLIGAGNTLLGGSPSRWYGPAWWLLSTFVVLGMIWLQVRVRRARPALDTALESSLGVKWLSSIRTEIAAGLRTTTPWVAGILLPLQRRSRAVKRIRNLPYGPHGRANLLDVYHSRRTDMTGPVLIHLHEGGFVQGGKSRESVTLLNQLAARGWLCISANYRLKADAVFPNPLLDTKRVIAWAREHAQGYGADPSHVFLVGCSAGGHLAVSAALTPNEPRLQPGFEGADTTITAAVSLYGYLGARTADPASSPVDLIRPDAPPLMLIHGTNDTVFPQGAPEAWAATMRSVSTCPVVCVELPDAQHAFDYLASVRFRMTADAIEAFFGWVRSQNPKPQLSPETTHNRRTRQHPDSSPPHPQTG